jgi:RHS repeat-associated protein
MTVTNANNIAKALNCDELGAGWEPYAEYQVILPSCGVISCSLGLGAEGFFGPSNVTLLDDFHHVIQKQSNDVYVIYLYRRIYSSKMYSQCYSPQAGTTRIYSKVVSNYFGADVNIADADYYEGQVTVPPIPDYGSPSHPEVARFVYRATGPNARAIINTSSYQYIEPPVPNQAPITRTFTDTTSYIIPLTDAPQIKPAEKALQDKASTSGPKTSGEPNFTAETHTKDPVDIFSGSFVIQNVDLAVPGILQPQVSRLYHSAFADKDGPFGKGTSMMPYNSQLTVKKDGNDQVIKAAGTEITYSAGDHTEITLKDTTGNLVFTAPDKTGFADSQITVQTDSQNRMTGAILRKSNGNQFLYDAAGYLASIQDRNGNAVSIMRNGNHQLTRLEDPSTQKGIDLVYDASGHATQATGLNGQTISYIYDEQGRLIRITDPLGQSISFTYDDKNQVISTTDARGTQLVQNTYSSEGRVTDQTLGDGSTMHIDYPNDTTRKVTDGTGDVMEHHYDSHGLFTGYKTPLNQTYTTTYSPALFDTSGGARTITNTDPQGRTVVTELNQRNQPVRVTDQAGRVTEMAYEPNFSLLSTIKDPLGRLTRFNYDAHGNVIEAIDPDGNSSTFTYNAQGQVLSATDAMGQKAQYAYNPSHDLTQVTDPMGNKTTYTYDTLSRLTQVTDAKGNSTQYSYDNLNRVTQITDALGNSTTFAYDENGNVVSVTDPNGHTTTASYDPMNRLLSTTNAKGETSSLSYDGDGNLTSATDAKGQTTHYTYNPLNQVTDVTYADGTQYHYSYDGLNRMTDVSAGTQQWHFAYDILDRLISENTPQGSLNYSYDAVSRLTGFSVPGNSYAPMQYVYDNLDRLIGITQNGKTYSYAYDSLGRRTGLTRPSGVTTSYEYDKASRLTAMTSNKGNTVLERHEYSYDANGNITQYVRGKGTSQPVVIKPCGKQGKGQIRQVLGFVQDKAETLSRTYQYDALNRLTDVDALGIVTSASRFKNASSRLAADVLINQAQRLTNPRVRQALLRNAEQLGAALPENASWRYDANGNLVQKVLHTTDGDQTLTYTYDKADRLVSLARPLDTDTNHNQPGHFHWRFPARHTQGGGPNHGPAQPQSETITMTYDANGNLVSDSTGRQMTWNALDQLTRLQTPESTVSFAYDPLGRRTSLSKGMANQTFLYRGQSMLSNGNAQFLDGAGIDEHLQLKAGSLNADYLTDHLGSTSHLVDSTNGQAKARLDYTSYGALEADDTNPLTANPYTYTGREDDDTGLMYYRARYYDPELGVFISQDPLGDAQRYVGGNPMSYTDPVGESGCTPTRLLTQDNSNLLPECHYSSSGNRTNEDPKEKQLKEVYKRFSDIAPYAMMDYIPGVNLPIPDKFIYPTSTIGKTPYKNITGPRSTFFNIETNISPTEFGQNLVKDGWKSYISKDGEATIFTKNGARYAIRSSSKNGPTADYYAPGNNGKADLKIRLRK